MTPLPETEVEIAVGIYCLRPQALAQRKLLEMETRETFGVPPTPKKLYVLSKILG
jgi:hypothetical protein